MKLKALTILLLLPLCLRGQTGSPFDGLRDKIEIPYATVGSWPVIEARVGSDTLRFVFDSGSSATLITDRAAEKLGLRAGRKTSVGDAHGNRSMLRVGTIRGLEIAGTPGFTIRKARTIVIDADNLIFRCYGVDGIIGCHHFRDHAVAFDSGNKKIVLLSGRGEVDGLTEKWGVLRHRRAYVPMLRVKAGGREYDALFDSGNASWPTLKDFSNLLQDGEILDYRSASGFNSIYGLFGTGDSEENHRGVLRSLDMGGTVLDSIPVVSSMKRDMNIPMAVTSFGYMVLDFPGDRYCFIPPKETTARWSRTFPRLDTTIERGRLKVLLVWDKELAEHIAPGDILHEVGGEAVEGLDDCSGITVDKIIKGRSAQDGNLVFVRPDGSQVEVPAHLFLNERAD